MTDLAPLTEYQIVGMIVREVGINPGTPAVWMVPGGSCWHCGESIKFCVVVRHAETGAEHEIGTTCAERVGLSKTELKALLAERYAEERADARQRRSAERRAERERLEAEATAVHGPHGTKTRFLAGCYCDRCHAAAPHGTIHRWDDGCRCDPCLAAKIATDRDVTIIERTVLVDLATGAVVSMKVVAGQYGSSWRTDHGFVTWGAKRRSTTAKKGYTEASAAVLAVWCKGTRQSGGGYYHPIHVVSLDTTDRWGEPIEVVP